MSAKSISLPVLVLLALALPTSAQAASRYASPTGAASADSGCLISAPCNIPDALSNAYLNDGDEVWLAAGSYTVTDELVLTKGVTVRGVAGNTVIQSNGTDNAFIVNDANAVLNDFELRHNSGSGAALVLYSGTVERTSFQSSVDNGCDYDDGTIRDSICATTASNANGFEFNPLGGATRNIVLRNMTIIASGASNSRGLFVVAGSLSAITVDAKSVIARGTTSDVYAAAVGGATINIGLANSNYANVVIAGDLAATVTNPATNNNQTAAPIFVNQASADYHQAASSPTIDAGVNDIFSGATDIDGQARPSGIAYDIGADEYVAPASPGPGPVADTTAPSTRITKKPRKKTRSRTAKFKFSSSEAGSTFRCKLDRGKYRSCKSSYNKRVKPGKHTLRVVATDAAGNRDATPAVFSWRVTRR